MHILVTGGAGYIGTHTVIELLQAGYDVTIVDNLYNSQEEAVRRGAELAGRAPIFHKVDLLDYEALEGVFRLAKYDAVIHFAGLKAVGESVQKPLFYYHNNMTGTFNLLKLMKQYGCRNIVFSSSATVYGMPEKVPLDEHCATGALNPYGATKLFLERVLTDVHAAEPDLGVMLLRYFNPVGAHPSGRIGENPNGIPNNLMPYIAQVAVGRLPKVRVFGDDYPTKDGTGVRDYIHVVDLARGHLAALKKLEAEPGAIYTVNLGLPRLRQGNPLRDRRPPPRRRPRVLRRPHLRQGTPRLAGHPHPRRHVRFLLEVAVHEPQRLRRVRAPRALTREAWKLRGLEAWFRPSGATGKPPLASDFFRRPAGAFLHLLNLLHLL